MKSLNSFIIFRSSRPNLQSSDVRHDRRLTVGSPSGFTINWTLKLVSVLVLVLSLGIGNVWGADVSVTISVSSDTWADVGTSGSGGTTSVTKSGITVSSTKGYKDGTNHIRDYQNSVITILSTVGNIKSIVFTCTASGTSDNGPSKLSKNNTKDAGKYTYSGKNGTWSFGSGTSNVSSVQLKATAQCRWTQVVVTYETAAPSYTVTASSNNNSWGTVSVNGTTITATPADCYQVASGSGGYSLTSGTASAITHDGNSNTISVTPTSDCSVQVIFEKKTVNTYVDELQGNEDIEECGTHDAPSLVDKAVTSSGTCAQRHWHFMGWVTSANKANPTDLNIITPGTEMTANGTTYYAVWAKGSSGGGFDGTHGGTFKIYADVSGTKHYATSSLSSGKFGSTTDASSAAEFTIESVTGGFTIKLGSDFVNYTSSTNLGKSNNSYTWTFASGTKGTWRANSGTSGRGFIYKAGTGFGGYSTSNVTTGGSEYFDLEIGGDYTYSDYKTSCEACTADPTVGTAQLNGSIKRVGFSERNIVIQN